MTSLLFEFSGAIFAKAWSIDQFGNERLIAQVEDRNSDGILSAGDTVKTVEYPKNFAGDDYGDFRLTEHMVCAVEIQVTRGPHDAQN